LHELDVGVLFFFSSRRRHTRSLRDWSSDVCSSDLWAYVFAEPESVSPSYSSDILMWSKLSERTGPPIPSNSSRKTATSTAGARRSEERRVGKERRSGWSPDDEQKNRCAAESAVS